MNVSRSLTLLFLVFVSVLYGCQPAPPAEYIELPVLFSDHMVLQRNTLTTIWGKATPKQRVTVKFKDQISETEAKEDSSWVIYLAPEPAGGPYTLSVSGVETTIIDDVLVGEVWLCSGQSNMQWSVEQSAHAEREIAAANYPNIRLFSVDRTVSDTPEYTIPSDGWHLTTPETIPSFSAVGYYFGRSLYDSLQVPIGLIHSSWGGTPAEAWTSSEMLETLPDFAEAIAQKAASNPESTYEMVLSDWLKMVESQDDGYVDDKPVWASLDHDHSSWATMDLPLLWEEHLPGYDGIVWFRKEFDLPLDMTGQDAVLHLANVDDIDITWVNGVEVGRTQQYNQKRTYTLNSTLLKSGKNVVAIRALDTGGGGGIWGEAADMRVELPQETIPLAGSWHYRTAIKLSDVAKRPPRPTPRHHTPAGLYNAMIHPLIPYRLQGAIWYQGESNAGRAHQYRTLFSSMIKDWRNHWDTNISFHFVQLANFQKQQSNPVERETWPELREAQTLALDLTHTGMAVSIDIGEADDIHPRNKQDVGYRLALNALHTTYGHDHFPAGPLYKSMTTLGDTVQLAFDYADNGFNTPDNRPILGFAIAGTDSVFHWAEASAKGNSISVFSPNVQNPIAVRYGWANNPVVNLYNVEGLPASPFRTDDWPLITKGAK